MLSITLQSLKPVAPTAPVTLPDRPQKKPTRWHLLPAEISFEAQSMLALYLRTTASPHGVARDWHRGYRASC